MTQRDEALAKVRAAKARFEDSLSLARHSLKPAKLGKRAATRVRPALPLTALGKIDKKALRARHWPAGGRAVH